MVGGGPETYIKVATSTFNFYETLFHVGMDLKKVQKQGMR